MFFLGVVFGHYSGSWVKGKKEKNTTTKRNKQKRTNHNAANSQRKKKAAAAADFMRGWFAEITERFERLLEGAACRQYHKHLQLV